MSSEAVARRYATALAEVALERDEAHTIQKELLEWEKMIHSSSMLQELVRNPTIPLDQKQTVLAQLIGLTRVSSTTANFLNVLLRNQRLGALQEINRRFALVLDDKAGVVSAEVTSARPIPDSSKAVIEENLKGITGKAVRIDFRTDESLIGGLITRIGSTVYDGSIRNQLEELGKRLAGT